MAECKKSVVEETKEKIAVMQAYVNGKKIEFKEREKVNWFCGNIPSWNWCDYEYRIKEDEKYKYQKGDYVLVLDGRDIPNYTGGFTSDMAKRIGRIYKIEDFCPEFRGVGYRLKGMTYCFDERGLAPVKIGG